MTEQDRNQGLDQLAGFLAVAKTAEKSPIDDAFLARFMEGEFGEGTPEHHRVLEALATDAQLRECWRTAVQLASEIVAADASPVASISSGNVIPLRSAVSKRADGALSRSRPKWLGTIGALAASLAVVTVMVRQPVDDPSIRDPITRSDTLEAGRLVPYGGVALEIAQSASLAVLTPALHRLWLDPDAPAPANALRAGYAHGVARVAEGLSAADGSWSALARAASAAAVPDCGSNPDCDTAAGLGAWALAASVHCSAANPDAGALAELSELASALVGNLATAAHPEWPAAQLAPDSVCAAATRIAGATGLSERPANEAAVPGPSSTGRDAEQIAIRLATDSKDHQLTGEMIAGMRRGKS